MRQCAHGAQQGTRRCENAAATLYCPQHGGTAGGQWERTTCPHCTRTVAVNPVRGTLSNHCVGDGEATVCRGSATEARAQ